MGLKDMSCDITMLDIMNILEGLDTSSKTEKRYDYDKLLSKMENIMLLRLIYRIFDNDEKEVRSALARFKLAGVKPVGIDKHDMLQYLLSIYNYGEVDSLEYMCDHMLKKFPFSKYFSSRSNINPLVHLD